MKILEVKNLTISFRDKNNGAWVPVVNNVSFDLDQDNNDLAIVGESGSGKTMIGRAIMGLLPVGARMNADIFSFFGQDLRNVSLQKWQSIRGKEIGLILQDPKYSLNPNMKIGPQIDEMYRFHLKMSPREAKKHTLDALESVKISEPKHVYERYVHEISGGMGQRAMIAMMLATSPKLLIADEPTSALDQDNKIKFLELVRTSIDARNMSLVLISHDLNMVRTFSKDILVMRKGCAVSLGPANKLSSNMHPYVQGLLRCVPDPQNICERLPTMDREKL